MASIYIFRNFIPTANRMLQIFQPRVGCHLIAPTKKHAINISFHHFFGPQSLY